MSTANYGIMAGTKYESGSGVSAPSRTTLERLLPMPLNDTPSENSVPYGYCQCGCGEKTTVARRSHRARGLVKGEPKRFIHGHGSRREVPIAAWSDEDRCWLIPLVGERGQGLFAKINDDDKEVVEGYRWNLFSNGRTDYAWTTHGNKSLQMHRLIVTPDQGEVVDHINGDGLDNRRENLRRATFSQNTMHQTRIAKHNSSGYRGVSTFRDGNAWRAVIGKDGKQIHVGVYLCPIEAAIARDIAALDLHGEFAALNYPALREVFK